MEKSERGTQRIRRSADHAVQWELFFRTVYEEQKKPLGTFLYRLVPHKQEVEDHYQEVLKKFWIHLQALQKLPTLEETRKWLFTVARHQVIDQYRRRGELLSGSLEEAEQTLCGPPLIDQWGEREWLQWGLAQMSSMYRICLVLQDLYGYSQKEIATQLNITKETVSTNVLRGRKQLLAVLDDVRRKKDEEATHDKSIR